MAKTRTRPVKSDTSEVVVELAPTVPHQVAETKRLIRLTPIANDLSTPCRQIALVAADTEDQARQLACAYDPFGRDWKNAELFSADLFDDTDTHVVGDVIFKSIPSPQPQKQKGEMKRNNAQTHASLNTEGNAGYRPSLARRGKTSGGE